MLLVFRGGVFLFRWVFFKTSRFPEPVLVFNFWGCI